MWKCLLWEWAGDRARGPASTGALTFMRARPVPLCHGEPAGVGTAAIGRGKASTGGVRAGPCRTSLGRHLDQARTGEGGLEVQGASPGAGGPGKRVRRGRAPEHGRGWCTEGPGRAALEVS